MEDNLTGRQHHSKTTSQEDNITVRQPQRKSTSKEDNFANNLTLAVLCLILVITPDLCVEYLTGLFTALHLFVGGVPLSVTGVLIWYPGTLGWDP